MNEEKIKKIADEINASNSSNLMSYGQSNIVSGVEILATKDSCEYCKKQQGKVYSIKNAIKNNPLPCKKCNHETGYCRCTYLPVV